MGVVIFTKDDTKYRNGDCVVLGRTLTSPPTAPDTTYILYTNSFTAKDVEYWMPVISYRLVVVGDRLPKMSKELKERIIIDGTHKGKVDFTRPIMGLFKWVNRSRVWSVIRTVPIALLASFLRTNNARNIELGRRLARCRYTLPMDYEYASAVYGVYPNDDQVEWPKKQGKGNELPMGFRKSDKYAERILNTTPDTANDLRRSEPEALPKGMKKREEKEVKWI
jgi:hypothetical protein